MGNHAIASLSLSLTQAHTDTGTHTGTRRHTQTHTDMHAKNKQIRKPNTKQTGKKIKRQVVRSQIIKYFVVQCYSKNTWFEFCKRLLFFFKGKNLAGIDSLSQQAFLCEWKCVRCCEMFIPLLNCWIVCVRQWTGAHHALVFWKLVKIGIFHPNSTRSTSWFMYCVEAKGTMGLIILA